MYWCSLSLTVRNLPLAYLRAEDWFTQLEAVASRPDRKRFVQMSEATKCWVEHNEFIAVYDVQQQFVIAAYNVQLHYCC